MPKVFVYGTLKQKHVEYTALGHNVKAAPAASVSGYAVRDLGKGYKTIEPSMPGAIVRGKILHVSTNDLHSLDAWESKYKRDEININETGETAWVYTIRKE